MYQEVTDEIIENYKKQNKGAIFVPLLDLLSTWVEFRDFYLVLKKCMSRGSNIQSYLENTKTTLPFTIFIPKNGWYNQIASLIESCPLEKLENFIKLHIIPRNLIKRIELHTQKLLLCNGIGNYLQTEPYIINYEELLKVDCHEKRIDEDMFKIGVKIQWFVDVEEKYNIPGNHFLAHQLSRPLGALYVYQNLTDEQILPLDLSRLYGESLNLYQAFMEEKLLHDMKKVSISDIKDEMTSEEMVEMGKQIKKGTFDETRLFNSSRPEINEQARSVYFQDKTKRKQDKKNVMDVKQNISHFIGMMADEEKETLEGRELHLTQTIGEGIKSINCLKQMAFLLDKHSPLHALAEQSSKNTLWLVPVRDHLKKVPHNSEESMVKLIQGMILVDFNEIDLFMHFVCDRSIDFLTMKNKNDQDVTISKQVNGTLIFTGPLNHTARNIILSKPLQFKNGYMFIMDNLVM